METPIQATREGETGEVVASYDTYAAAERAVDQLSDASFPVEQIKVVGRDLRLVERITGRVTIGRATAAGAGSGAWFGLFIGLLVGLFTTGPEWLGLVIGGLVIGAVWGAVFGFVAHWALRGRRDSPRRAGSWPVATTSRSRARMRSGRAGSWRRRAEPSTKGLNMSETRGASAAILTSV